MMQHRADAPPSRRKFAIPALGRLYAGLEADAWLLVRVGN